MRSPAFRPRPVFTAEVFAVASQPGAVTLMASVLSCSVTRPTTSDGAGAGVRVTVPDEGAVLTAAAPTEADVDPVPTGPLNSSSWAAATAGAPRRSVTADTGCALGAY